MTYTVLVPWLPKMVSPCTVFDSVLWSPVLHPCGPREHLHLKRLTKTSDKQQGTDEDQDDDKDNNVNVDNVKDNIKDEDQEKEKRNNADKG